MSLRPHRFLFCSRGSPFAHPPVPRHIQQLQPAYYSRSGTTASASTSTTRRQPSNPAAFCFSSRRLHSRSSSSSLWRRRYVTSGFDSLYIVVAATTAAAAASVAAYYYAWPSASPANPEEGEEEKEEEEEEDYDTMASEEIPPGHLGNLNAEQEAKLREMWYQLFKVGNMLPADMPSESNYTGSAAAAAAASSANSVRDDGASTMTKKSKKRFGMFRKGNAEGDEAVEDDKHGQMKDYEQALKDQTPEQLRETIWSFVKADNPDALLLRFLRARKWNVQRALIMMISTVHWRGKVIRMDDDLIHKGEEWFAVKDRDGDGYEKQLGHDFMAQIRMGKSFLHGCDYQERPLCYIRVRLHHGGDQLAESIEKYTIYTIETARMLMKGRNETAVVVFDMTGFGIANMLQDYTPVKFMIKCFEANYPECLGAVCVFRSPWIFNTFWNIIKGWLDPVVASKIHFTKDANELSQYIPMERIPKELGGEDEWEYSFVEPIEGENYLLHEAGESERQRLLAERKQISQNFEDATVDWIKCLGKNDAKVVERRADLAEQLRQSYWQLDPYLRARTVYDREGVIQGGGNVDFYPTKAAKEKATEEIAAAAKKANGGLANGKGYNPRKSVDAESIYYDAQEEFD